MWLPSNSLGDFHDIRIKNLAGVNVFNGQNTNNVSSFIAYESSCANLYEVMVIRSRRKQYPDFQGLFHGYKSLLSLWQGPKFQNLPAFQG